MTRDSGLKNGDKNITSNGSGVGEYVPKFFKIISNVHKLRLPPDFMRRYGHSLSECLSLKVPNGLVWKVELIRSDGEAWLHGGWERLVEYYSIQFGHSLLFEYVGDSHFEVHIFDTTATEIEYSHYGSLERDAGMNQVAETGHVESESDDSVVFVKEILADDAVTRVQEADGIHSEKLRRSSRGKQKISSPNQRSDIDEHNEGTDLKYPGRKEVLEQARDHANNRFKAYTRALAFMSEKPTPNRFTIIVMHPSYVSTQHSAVHIPPAFAREILTGKGDGSLLLVSEGKTWVVRYVYGKRRASLTSGWGKFIEDNELKAGDACVFEDSKRINDQLTWDVIIFRG